MECFEALLSRRSVRVFKDEEVPTDLILKAVDVSRFAPSAKNRQPWEFVIITERDRILKLADMLRWSDPLRRCKVAVVVLADREASPTSYLVDGAIVATYFWVALHCLGLGAVWIQTLYDPEGVAKFVGAPERFVAVAAFAIGWPAEKPEPKPRKELRELVSFEEYGRRVGGNP